MIGRSSFAPAVLVICSMPLGCAQQPAADSAFRSLAPTNATSFCSGHVLGTEGDEIVWESFHTVDSETDVAEYYERTLPGLGFELADGGTWSLDLPDTKQRIWIDLPDADGVWDECSPPRRASTIVTVSAMY